MCLYTLRTVPTWYSAASQSKWSQCLQFMITAVGLADAYLGLALRCQRTLVTWGVLHIIRMFPAGIFLSQTTKLSCWHVFLFSLLGYLVSPKTLPFMHECVAQYLHHIYWKPLLLDWGWGSYLFYGIWVFLDPRCEQNWITLLFDHHEGCTVLNR